MNPQQRHLGRQLALQWLFQIDVGHQTPEEVLAVVPEANELAGLQTEAIGFAQLLTRGVLADRPRIDEAIEKYAKGWSIDRIAAVDRNILRIALCEILNMPDIPASVSVDEAVEVAKEFSSDDSGKFVNGILGAFLRGERGRTERA